MPVQRTITLYHIDELRHIAVLDSNPYKNALAAFYQSETFKAKQQELADDLNKLASDLKPYKANINVHFDNSTDSTNATATFTLNAPACNNPVFTMPLFPTDGNQHAIPTTRFYDVTSNTGADTLDRDVNNAISMMEDEAEEIIDNLEDGQTDSQIYDQLTDEAEPLFRKLYEDIYEAVTEYVNEMVADWNNESVIDDIAANMLFTAEGDLYEE